MAHLGWDGSNQSFGATLASNVACTCQAEKRGFNNALYTQ
jgi:hypothetical protein